MDFERYSMIYRKEDNKDKIRIFGEHFVKNNKNKCKIIYKNKVYPLKEFLIFIYNLFFIFYFIFIFIID